MEYALTAEFWRLLATIAGINVLLSGDNAVVIALASRGLPAHQRRMAVLGGSLGAIGLRVVFCLAVAWLLAIPFLKLLGGLLLLWIGARLMVPERGGRGGGVAARVTAWGAMQTIVVADTVMSLDNGVAIAAIARGDALLIVLGLLISVPLIVFGSALVLKLLLRYPLLVAAGAGLLGWIAGAMIAGDAALVRALGAAVPRLELLAGPLGAVLVLAAGGLMAWRGARRPAEIVDLAPSDRQ